MVLHRDFVEVLCRRGKYNSWLRSWDHKLFQAFATKLNIPFRVVVSIGKIMIEKLEFVAVL